METLIVCILMEISSGAQSTGRFLELVAAKEEDHNICHHPHHHQQFDHLHHHQQFYHPHNHPYHHFRHSQLHYLSK